MTIWYAGIVTLAGSILIFAITVWLISSARPAQSVDTVVPRLYKVRGWYFLLLMFVLATLLVVTLSNLPYRTTASVEPEYVVPVTGRTWFWEIGPMRNRDGQLLQAKGEQLVLPVGKSVEFQVTSKDVNHGFGIYDETGQLIAQVQAMPGYVNNLVHTFAKPGTYHVLCMEYCGLAHHSMVATMTVK